MKQTRNLKHISKWCVAHAKALYEKWVPCVKLMYIVQLVPIDYVISLQSGVNATSI